jgi:hypothetical protein
MPDSGGWPDPTNPGVPLNPTEVGPHWVMDESGTGQWAWWRGRDGMWQHPNGESSASWMGTRWRYVGPAIVPT